MTIATKTVDVGDTGADTYTTGAIMSGNFLVSISGLLKGLVVLERSHDSGTTYKTVRVFNRNVEKELYASGAATLYRLRVVDLAASPGVVLRLEDGAA